jgi:hypothetical protein
MQIEPQTHGVVGIGFGQIGVEADLDDKRIQEIITSVKDCLSKVDPELPSSCVDGRKAICTLDETPTEPRPSLAAGSLISAYVAAEFCGWFTDNDPKDVVSRISMVKQLLESQKINCGGHCDEIALAAKFDLGSNRLSTGCGADDRLPEIIQNIQNNVSTVKAMTNQLVEPLAPDIKELEIKLSETASQILLNDWDPSLPFNILSESNKRSIEVLKCTKEHLHGHEEVALVVNYQDETTLDRDSLVEQYDIQVFDVDMWYVERIARALARGPEAVEQYSSLLNALAAFQVGTYITLSNGSQLLITIP